MSVTRRDVLKLLANAPLAGALLATNCIGSDEPAQDESPTAASSRSPSPTSTPAHVPATPTQSPVAIPAGAEAPNDIVIETLGEVSDQYVEEIHRAAGLVRAFYRRELGLYVDGPVHIVLVQEPSLPLHAVTYLSEDRRISSITVNVGSPSWAAETIVEHLQVVAHEYYHVIQSWLQGEHPPGPELFFMVEGGAEYAGFATVIDAGLMSYSEMRKDSIERIRRGQIQLPPLDQITADTPGFSKYLLSRLAVDFLVGERGLHDLTLYFLRRKQSNAEEAFEATFEEPLRRFYSRFALWRNLQKL